MQEQQLRSYLRNMRQSGVKHAFLHGTSKEQMHLAAMNGPQDQCSKRITAVPGASAQDSQEGATPKQSKAPVVRLYDKLDQLEKRWMSQKAPKSKAEARTLDQSTVSTRRDQPEPSPKVTKKTQRPRVVSTFDKLYQKGKAMGIARHRIPQSPSHPPVNRQKRRQESATKIQRVFRGKKARECFRGYQGAATVILLWWKNRIIHRLHFLRLLHATIIVQSLTRKRVVLNAINQKQKAAVVIQEFWRTIQTKKRQLALIKTLLEQANVAKKAECLATNDKATPVTDEKGQNPVASSESLTTIYRAAKLRRKKAGKTALSKTEEDYQCSHRARSSSCHRSRSDANNDRTGSRARSASPSPRVLDMVQRPAYAYLPGRSYKKDRKFRITNFLRGCYDEEMLSKLHILQKWTRVQLRNLIVRHACVKIQACWRHYQAQTQLVSDILLKEWAVRVNFLQEEMTSNPVLRQKVRLLALTKALRRVSEGRVSQDVANTSESFIVDWETGVSIYSRESREFNRCTIHVQCEAYRHSIWESWTEDKIFTRLSRAALMKSFANQCKRLSHASMLAMRQMLMQAAREKKAAMMIQRQARKFVKVKSFQRVRKSVLCFQALWRMTRQLREYALLNRSACVIQAFYRVYAAETKYLEFLAGLVRLQARSRGIIQRKIKATRVACATKIEALFRGSSARCFYAQNTKACTTIQSWYRGITLYRCYSRMRKVHETLQALARRRLILHQIKQEESVIKLQSWWRRLAWSSYYVSLLRCVCMIQAMFRGFKVKQLYQKSLNDRLLVTNKKHIAFCSAILIQRWYRTMVNRVNLKAKIQRKVAQRYCNKLREETRAANKIQLWGEKVVATREVENRRQWSKARIIQAMVRGTVVRSRIQTQHEAARVIQHFFREFSSRQATIFNMKIEMAIRSRVNNQYIRQDTAASMLSDFSVDNVHDVKQHYQLCATMTFPVNNLKGSAIVIQAAYRAHLCKRRFSLLKASVRLIQSYWRTVLFERRALPIHADSCCLENASVGLDVVEVERTSWLKMVQSIAAILLQSLWRMQVQRRKYQSYCAKKSQEPENEESSMDLALVQMGHDSNQAPVGSSFYFFDNDVFPSFPLAISSCLQSVEHFDTLCGKDSTEIGSHVSKVQRWYRTRKMRQVILRSLRLTLAASKVSERTEIKSKLKLFLLSARHIQSSWRLWMKRQATRKAEKATKIQAVARRAQSRQLARRIRSTLVIQQFVRAMFVRIGYVAMHRGFLGFQMEWFRYSNQPEYRKKIEKRDHGLSILQRLAKKQFQNRTEATTTIQRKYRVWKRQQQRLYASILIQKQWRCIQARSTFSKTRKSIFSLQTTFRRNACSSRFQKMARGFLALQTIARRNYDWKRKTESSVTIQRHIRRYILKAKYTKMYNGFISFQNFARQQHQTKTTSVLLLQKHQRMTSKWRAFNKLRSGTILVQSRQRGIVARATYEKQLRGFVVFQKAFKLWFDRKTNMLATVIQSEWRRFRAQSSYQKMRIGFSKVQEYAKHHFMQKMTAAIILERNWRMHSAKTQFCQQRRGAIYQQKTWRGYSFRSRYTTQCRGFVALQQIWKGHFDKKVNAAIMLQRESRMEKALREYNRFVRGVKAFQTVQRRLACQRAYAKMRSGFLLLQELLKVRFRVKSAAAVSLQAETRRFLVRKHFEASITSVVKVQSVFRGFVERRNLVVLRWLRSVAATMLASWWRRIVYETKYRRIRGATISLQQRFRIHQMEKEAATLISSFYRRSRNRQIILAGAATVIQRAWRQSQQRFVDRCMEITRTRIEGALVIQRWWARMQSSRRQNEILREQQASSEEPTAVTDITKTEMNSERGVKSNPFSLCDFRIEMFSPALDIGSFLSWGNYAEQEIEVAITDKYLSASFEIASSGESISRSQKILLRNLEGQEEFRQSVSATLIASAWKGYHCRKKYLDIIHRRRLWLRGQAVLAIQQAWSCYQKRCFEHRQATRIQCIWRMHAQRSEFVAMQWLRALCARQIQCTWRMSRARGEFLKARAAAVVIQDMVRTVQNRKVAAIKLQRVWRLYMLTHKKGTSSSRSRLLFSVPAMVVQAGLAWVLSDPRVIEFALRGGN